MVGGAHIREPVGRTYSRLITIAAVAALLGAACASPEDQLRADLQDEGISDDSIDCVVDAFAAADVDGGSSGTARSSDCLEGVFTEVFASEFAELEQSMAAAFEEGFSGLELSTADAVETPPVDLEALADACRAGDNVACDELWLASPIDSPEEQLAESCGGRSPEPLMGSCDFWLD